MGARVGFPYETHNKEPSLEPDNTMLNAGSDGDDNGSTPQWVVQGTRLLEVLVPCGRIHRRLYNLPSTKGLDNGKDNSKG